MLCSSVLLYRSALFAQGHKDVRRSWALLCRSLVVWGTSERDLSSTILSALPPGVLSPQGVEDTQPRISGRPSRLSQVRPIQLLFNPSPSITDIIYSQEYTLYSTAP
jgi:hypothetical protein